MAEEQRKCKYCGYKINNGSFCSVICQAKYENYMNKEKLKEMTAAGSGATIGPIQPLGASKESVEEMLSRHPDLRSWHMAVFARNADHFLRESFGHAARVDDFEDMANMVREEVTRQAIRRKMNEVVRKKDGKYVLYAPNTGKKHPPKPVAVFSTKLAAKRAELAKFPPKDPEKLERLKKQIEKLLKDPKARAKEITMKEKVDRDLFETALLSMIVGRDVMRTIGEGIDRSKPADEYQAFVNQFSQKALQGDKGYRGAQKTYQKAAASALGRKVKEVEEELGMKVKSQEPKKHTDGKMRVLVYVAGDCPVPVSFVADGKKVKTERMKETEAALTKCSEPVADKIRSRLFSVNEEDIGDDPELAQANDHMVGRTKKIFKFVDEFLAKLSPLAMTVLKRLLAKKYRKLGTAP